jgi:hypothetical protein
MADIHIADFHRDCANILVNLYRHFPRKINLYVEDISGRDEPDEFGLPSPRHQSCFSAMIWLAESGYIQYVTTIRQEALDQVCLTHMGFLLLSSIRQQPVRPALRSEEYPDNVHKIPGYKTTQEPATAKTYVQHLRYEVKSGSSLTLEALILDLFENSQQFR